MDKPHKRVTCPWCNRDVALTLDGVMFKHIIDPPGGGNRAYCDGSRKHPLEFS
jgi:hypothetical protein